MKVEGSVLARNFFREAASAEKKGNPMLHMRERQPCPFKYPFVIIIRALK